MNGNQQSESYINATLFSYPDGSSLTQQFNLAGRLTNLTDGAGLSWQLAYNNQGLPTALSNAYGAVLQAQYDILDRAVALTNASGVIVNQGYDVLDRLISRTWAADGFGERFVYTNTGLIYHTNRDSQPMQFGRDPIGRLTSVTNALSQTNQFIYSAAGDLVELVDALGHQTSWSYSQYGWPANKLDNNGNPVIIYTCDPDGRVTNRWTVGTNNTGYAYDAVGNVTNVTYSNAQPVTLSYAYDALNQLTNMIDPVGTTTLSYTPGRQLQTEILAATGWSGDTVSNSYTQGRRTGLALTQPSGSWSQTYGYDSAGRLQTLTATSGTYTYGRGSPTSPSALVRSLALPNSALITNGCDNLARLQFTALMNQWGHVLDGYTYAYDHLGLRTGITRNFGLGYNSVSVGYDNIGEITNWTASEVSGTPRQNEQIGYGYDAAGNLHLRTNGALVETFTVGVSNQIQSVGLAGTLTVSGVTTAPATRLTVNGTNAQIYSDFAFASTNNGLTNGSNIFTVIAQDIHGTSATNVVAVNLPTPVTFKYDGNGNLTNDGTRSFVYDVENQLTNVFVTGAWRVDFIYDGLRRRRITREYSWNGTTWTRTNEIRNICDGNLVLQERDSNNVVQVTYTHGLDLSGSISGAGGIGGLLARTDANGSTFYHADGNGNITSLMDANENEVARYLYDGFGRMLGQSGAMAPVNRIRFSSKWYASQADIYDFGYRWYPPNLDGWLNRDPMGEAGGLNLYTYVGNSPIDLIDPYGEDAYTIGPVTIPVPFTTPDWEKPCQRAHEAQHRADFWHNFSQPGWKKEQRGFAAEIPVLKNQISWDETRRQWNNDLKAPDQTFDKEMQDQINNLNKELDIASSIANSDQNAVDYWNSAARRWYQSPAVAPPPTPWLRNFEVK